MLKDRVWGNTLRYNVKSKGLGSRGANITNGYVLKINARACILDV